MSWMNKKFPRTNLYDILQIALNTIVNLRIA